MAALCGSARENLESEMILCQSLPSGSQNHDSEFDFFSAKGVLGVSES